MDTRVRPAGAGQWSVEGAGGAALGAIEQAPGGFVVVPAIGSPLEDLDTPPYVSLETAMEGIAGHCGGSCVLARDS